MAESGRKFNGSAELNEKPPVVQGWLQKKGQVLGRWNWRFVRLTANCRLQTFTSDPSGDDRVASETDNFDLRVRGTGADVCNTCHTPSAPFGFALTIGPKSGMHRTILLAADSDEVRQAWLQAIAEAANGSSTDAASPKNIASQEAKGGAVNERDESKRTAFPDAVTTEEVIETNISKKLSGEDASTNEASNGKASHLDAMQPGQEAITRARSQGDPQSGKGVTPGKAPRGKGMPPGKAPPVKGASPGKAPLGKGMPPGKAPLGKGPPVKAASKGGIGSSSTAPSLPIGRRLSVRAVAGVTGAEAFGGDPSNVDLDALRSVFSPQTAGTGEANNSAATRRSSRIELLPRDTAQNVAIVVRKLRIDPAVLADALDRLEPAGCTLTSDEAERLCHALPSTDLLQPIKEYGKADKDPQKLRDIERILLPLAMLTRLAPRLRLLVLSKTLGERLGDVVLRMSNLQAACEAVRSSSVLRDLLAIVLRVFNYVNFGSGTKDESQSCLRTVDVQSLIRLQETKAYGGPFPRYNMLHFCLQQLIQQRQDLCLEDLGRELSDLPHAAGTSLVEIRHGLTQLRDDLEFAHAELHGHHDEYAGIFENTPEVPKIPDPVPKSPEPPKAPLPQSPPEFSIDSSDLVAEESDEEVSPFMEKRRSLLKRFLAKGMDIVLFTQEWLNGDSIVGKANHFADAMVPEDGEIPPPGMLWRRRCQGEWEKCWGEVRASLLVLYTIDSKRVSSTSYVVLPSAEVMPLHSIYASERARRIAKECPNLGFEVRPVTGGGRPEIFRAGTAREAVRWIDFLDLQAHGCGVGFLSLHIDWNLLNPISAERRLFLCA